VVILQAAAVIRMRTFGRRMFGTRTIRMQKRLHAEAIARKSKCA